MSRRGRGRGVREPDFRGFSPRVYGSDLILWLRDNAGITLSTVGEWKDQSPSGLLFAQATQANRPTAISGGAKVLAAQASGVLDGGTTAVAGLTGACTSVLRFQKATTPTNAYPGAYSLRMGATTSMAVFIDALGWRPFSFHTGSGADWFGFSDWAKDTAEHVALWTWDGLGQAVGNFTGRMDSVAKTVATTAGVSGVMVNSLMAIPGLANPLNGTLSVLVVYNSVLSAANQAAAEVLAAAGSGATYADFAALGTVVCCLLPGVGQSGDVSAWADQGPAGNNVSQATLASQPYWDYDDSVGDAKASVVFADDKAIAAGALVSNLTAVTLSVWARLAHGAAVTIAGQGRTSPYGFYFYSTASGVGVGIGTATGTIPTTGGVWEHVLWVYDGAGATNADRLKGYVGGVAQTVTFTGTIPAAVPNSADVFSVGWYDGTGFAGRLDQVVLVKRALTPGQVAQLARYQPRSG